MIRPLVVLLALSSLAWTPIPTAISPVVPLAEPTVHVPQYPEASDISSDGESFFVVSSEYVVSGAHHHLGMLLDENGERRLQQSEHLTSRGGWRPAVAWSGRVYLAVWDEFGETLGMRFTREGQPIDKTPIRIRGSVRSFDLPPYSGWERDVAWDGTHFIVVTELSQGVFAAARVDEGGRVVANGLPAAGSRIAARNGVSVLVAGSRYGFIPQSEVAAGADDFFVVTAGKPLRGRFLDASGQPKGAEILLADDGREPAVTWDGARYVVAFTAGTGQNPEVRAVRVGLDAEPLLIATQANTPALASNGTRVLVTWSTWGATRGALQRAFLDELDPEPVHRWPNARDAMQMSAAGGNALVAWFEYDRNLNGQVRIQPLRNGVPLPETTIAADGRPVAFASNGAEALLAVYGEQNRTSRFLRIDPMGNVLSDVTIADSLPYDTADLVWTGAHYLYVWREYFAASQSIEIRAVRISADGALLDDRGKALMSGSAFDLGSPFLAVAGDRTLLVVSSRERAGVETRFIAADLFVTPAESAPTGDAFAFDLVSDGTGFLLTYARRGTSVDTIAWQKFQSNGTRGPAGEVRLGVKHEYHSTLRAFWTGENYLLVWSRVAAQRRELQAMRVTPEGVAIDVPSTIASEHRASTVPFWKTVMHLAEPRRLELAYVDWIELGQYEQNAVFRSLGPARRRAVR